MLKNHRSWCFLKNVRHCHKTVHLIYNHSITPDARDTYLTMTLKNVWTMNLQQMFAPLFRHGSKEIGVVFVHLIGRSMFFLFFSFLFCSFTAFLFFKSEFCITMAYITSVCWHLNGSFYFTVSFRLITDWVILKHPLTDTDGKLFVCCCVEFKYVPEHCANYC